MVHKIHTSTLKAAQAKGFDILGEADDELYTFTWAEGKKKLQHSDVKVGLADIARWRMIALEYPKIKVAQAEDGTWSLKKGKTMLAEGFATIQEAWDGYVESESNGGDEGADQPDDGGDGTESRSIVKKQYRDAYRENDHTNGDDLAQKFKSYTQGADGKMDREKLIRFATANDLWDDKYDRLNNGQARMNVGNKLRKRIEKDQFQPKWVK